MRRPAARTRSRSRAAMGTGTRGSWAAGGGAAGRRGGGRWGGGAAGGGRQRQGCGLQHTCGSCPSGVERSFWEPRPKLRLRRLALASAARLHPDWRWLRPAPLSAGSADAKASVDWGGLDGLDRLGRRLASFLSGDDCGLPRTARSRPGAAVQAPRRDVLGGIPSAICCARAVCMAMMAAIRRRLCAHTRSCRSDVGAQLDGWAGVGWVRSAKAGVGCTAPVRPCSPTVSAPHHTATALLPTALPHCPCWYLLAPASTC